jgi:hypothetical protein
MATREAAAPTGRILGRGILAVTAAAAIVVALGAMGLASNPGAAVSEHGAMSRPDQAWAERLGAFAARQDEVAIARERANTAYANRLTAQSDALAAQRLERERASAAYSERLTRLAEHLAGQTP